MMNALICTKIPPTPDNFKMAIKYWTYRLHFIMVLNKWQTLYSHLRLILGRDPFKVIRLYVAIIRGNKRFLCLAD